MQKRFWVRLEKVFGFSLGFESRLLPDLQCLPVSVAHLLVDLRFPVGCHGRGSRAEKHSGLPQPVECAPAHQWHVCVGTEASDLNISFLICQMG